MGAKHVVAAFHKTISGKPKSRGDIPEERIESVRKQLKRAAPEHADAILQTLLDAMSVRKEAWASHTCKCGISSRVRVKINDATAAVTAARVLTEIAEGRPGVAEDATKEQVVIHRIVCPCFDDCSRCVRRIYPEPRPISTNDKAVGSA